ncbi:hypothetical protein [Roseivivax sp. CAU 1753]
MDKPRRMTDTFWMRCVQTLLLVVITVMLLPWGAYAADTARAASGAVAAVDTPDQGDALNDDQPESVRPTVAPVRKACRMAMLPGASCAPDRALPETVTTRRDAPWQAVVLAIPDLALEGRMTAPPREPPRFV